MKTLIVGAGITGLTMARCMQKLGCEVTIVDQVAKNFLTDYPISIYPSAQETLLTLFDEKKLTSLSTPCRSPGFRLINGDWILQPDSKAGQTNMVISKRKLTQLLINEPTPLDIIYDYKLASIEGYGNPGRVSKNKELEDIPIIATSTNHTSLGADLLIAADGQHSSCRSLINPSSRRNLFNYTGLCKFGGLIPLKTSPFEPSHTIFGIDSTFSLYYLNDEEIGWSATLPIPLTDVPSIKGKWPISLGPNLDMFKPFMHTHTHTHIQEVLEILRSSSSCYIEPLFEDELSCYSYARVGFVGASAFAYSPYLMDAHTSIGIEDCGQLTSFLAKLLDQTNGPPTPQTTNFSQSTHPTIQRYLDSYNKSRKGRLEELILNAQFLRPLISKHRPILRTLIKYAPKSIINKIYKSIMKL